MASGSTAKEMPGIGSRGDLKSISEGQLYMKKIGSQWKIIDLNSGKAITNRCGAAGSAQLNAYSGAATDNWAIDDHNGHFVIRNKASNAYLQAPSTAASATIQVTTNYSGTPDTDWDLYAVDSL